MSESGDSCPPSAAGGVVVECAVTAAIMKPRLPESPMNLFPTVLIRVLSGGTARAGLGRRRIIGLFCGLAICSVACADGAHPCASETDPQARLACYDQSFPPINATLHTRPAPRGAAELQQEFGLSSRELEDRKPASEREPEIDYIEALVAEVRGIQGGQRVLHLDNGQTWQLTEGGSKGPLRSGDRVTVRRALFGSYILTTPGGIGLRARRVQ
jgi:hypothetical protein